VSISGATRRRATERPERKKAHPKRRNIVIIVEWSWIEQVNGRFLTETKDSDFRLGFEKP